MAPSRNIILIAKNVGRVLPDQRNGFLGERVAKIIGPVETSASMAWVRTSMPVSTATWRGTESTRFGSRMAQSGISSSAISGYFRPFADRR